MMAEASKEQQYSHPQQERRWWSDCMFPVVVSASHERNITAENNSSYYYNDHLTVSPSVKEEEQQQQEQRIQQYAVTIPYSGWFGVCFTQSNDNAEEDNENEERNRRRETKSGVVGHALENCISMPVGKFILSITTTTTVSSSSGIQSISNSKIMDHSLPKNESKVEVLIKPLQDGDNVALHVGHLYYLPEKSSATLEIHLTSGSIRRIQNKLRWYLVSRRLEQENVNAMTIKATTKNPMPGTMYSAKKLIVCATCLRLFPSVRAVVSHRQVRHAPSSSAITRGDSNSSDDDDDDDDESDKELSNSPLPKQLEVLYHDDHMAVVNKPQGIAVMGDKASLCRSGLFMPLAGPLKDKENSTTDSTTGASTSERASITYLRKPIFVHRLDSATGGLLCVAKTKEAERKLKECFATRACKKQYRALVVGRLEPVEGTIDTPMHRGKPAVTQYRVRQHHCVKYGKLQWLTDVDLIPETGRKHQLRKHMKSVGHPILGDKRYGGMLESIILNGEDKNKGKSPHGDGSSKSRLLMSRLCLWATELTLPHPVTGKELHIALKNPGWLDFVVQKCAPQSYPPPQKIQRSVDEQNAV